MLTATKASMILIRVTDSLINVFMLITIMLLFALGCYAMWDSGQVRHAASSARYERYRPTAEDDGASFAYLQAKNPDVFAWLTIYGTNIDYPVVQGKDNIRYVNTNAEGKHCLSGAIFLDFRNASAFADFNNILYGHHMDSRTMFGEIGMFIDKDYFNTCKYGTLFFDGQTHGLEFFAFVHTDAHNRNVFRTNITSEEARQTYLDLLLEEAIHTRESVRVTVDDRIVLLTTCSSNSTNGRDILVGKITENISAGSKELNGYD